MYVSVSYSRHEGRMPYLLYCMYMTCISVSVLSMLSEKKKISQTKFFIDTKAKADFLYRNKTLLNTAYICNKFSLKKPHNQFIIVSD